MAIKFSPDTMTCAMSGHNARLGDKGAWSVSWLPGRALDRNAAITALSIAEAVAQIADNPGRYDRLRPHITGWAAELGFGAVEAVEAVAQGAVWTVKAGEGTAKGPVVPVIAGGAVLAVLSALWDDSDGVRVSIDWQFGTDDMTSAQALVLAEALRMVAGVPGPRQ